MVCCEPFLWCYGLFSYYVPRGCFYSGRFQFLLFLATCCPKVYLPKVFFHSEPPRWRHSNRMRLRHTQQRLLFLKTGPSIGTVTVGPLLDRDTVYLNEKSSIRIPRISYMHPYRWRTYATPHHSRPWAFANWMISPKRFTTDLYRLHIVILNGFRGRDWERTGEKDVGPHMLTRKILVSAKKYIKKPTATHKHLKQG